MTPPQQPWNLSRTFGRQFVVCVGSPSRSEAGIVARVIPAQSSRRTFRGPSDADLATCVLDSSHGSDVPTTFNSKVGDFAASLSSKPRLPSQGPAIVPMSPPVLPRGTIFLILSFPLETARNHSALCDGHVEWIPRSSYIERYEISQDENRKSHYE
jgi:hypothetical protein